MDLHQLWWVSHLPVHGDGFDSVMVCGMELQPPHGFGMASPLWHHPHRSRIAAGRDLELEQLALTLLSASPAGAERTRRGGWQLRSRRAWDAGLRAWGGAHRGKLCPPTAHPPWSEGAGSGHRSPPSPPHRRAARWERAELVLPAPSHQGTYPAPLTPAAGPGTGSWWHRGRRRPTAAAEPACRGEPSQGGLLPPPSPRVVRGPSPDPPLPPRRFYSPEGEREPRGRCLPCAAAPRSTPGCPGGCSGWRRHPSFTGAERAQATICLGDAAECVPSSRRGVMSCRGRGS